MSRGRERERKSLKVRKGEDGLLRRGARNEELLEREKGKRNQSQKEEKSPCQKKGSESLSTTTKRSLQERGGGGELLLRLGGLVLRRTVAESEGTGRGPEFVGGCRHPCRRGEIKTGTYARVGVLPREGGGTGRIGIAQVVVRKRKRWGKVGKSGPHSGKKGKGDTFHL